MNEMKKSKNKNETIFFCCSIDTLDASLATHVHSKPIQSARLVQLSKKYAKYSFNNYGQQVQCGGVHKLIKSKHFPSYKDNRSRRARGTQVKGSSKQKGKRVDRELALAVEGRLPMMKKHDPFTDRLLAYFSSIGHTLQAAQVPCELPGPKMTQADLITQDHFHCLWLWELKTGMPVGFHMTQGVLRNVPLMCQHCGALGRAAKCAQCGKPNAGYVDSKKLNQWHLQLHYTRQALVKAGVRISQSRVIQIYQHAKKGIVIEVHQPPAWIANVRVF